MTSVTYCCASMFGTERNDERDSRMPLVRAARVIACLALIVIAAVPRQSSAQDIKAHQVKAVYLYNFASFVSWPRSVFRDPNAPLVYCVIDETDTSLALRQVLDGEKINGRPFEVRPLSQNTSPAGCHILYIDKEQASDLPEILRGLDSKGILVVTDFDVESSFRVTINLLEKRDRINPVINLGVARSQSLSISSKLLRIATVVDSRAGVSP